MKEIQMDGDNFSIWMPVSIVRETIEKASGGKEEKQQMILQGIASTDDQDMDEQILLNKGFDIEYFVNRGVINWHHQSKTDPSAIIGEPMDAKITKEGLFVKGLLYDTPVAKDAYQLAETLEKQSKTRRLGWSIEGKAIEKKGNVITKAKITGLALTHAPKNPHTFAELCKAMTDGSTTMNLLSPDADGGKFIFETQSSIVTFDKKGNLHMVEKAMEAGVQGKVVSRESLEGGLKVQGQKGFSTSLNTVLTRVFRKYPDVTFQKALDVATRVLENRTKKNK